MNEYSLNCRISQNRVSISKSETSHPVEEKVFSHLYLQPYCFRFLDHMPWGREPTVMVIRRVCLPAQLSSVQSLEKMPALVHWSHQKALKILDHPCFTLTHKEQCTIVLESVSHLTLRVTFQGSQGSQNRVNLIPTHPFSLQLFLFTSATSVSKWGEATPTSSNCLWDWGRAHLVQGLLKELFPQYSSKAQQFSSLTKNWPEAEPSLLFLFPAPDSSDTLLGAIWKSFSLNSSQAWEFGSATADATALLTFFWYPSVL